MSCINIYTVGIAWRARRVLSELQGNNEISVKEAEDANQWHAREVSRDLNSFCLVIDRRLIGGKPPIVAVFEL